MKSFISFINETITKKEFKQTLKDEGFNIGVEFEFFIKNGKSSLDVLEDFINDTEINISSYIDLSVNKEDVSSDGKAWLLSIDTSLETKNKNDIGLELASPILKLKNIENFVPKVFSLIDTYGYTNNTCGFHINISHDLFNKQNINIDNLINSIEDQKIYQQMPSRRFTHYAISSEYKKQYMPEEELYSKYGTVNIRHNNRVEFRGLGGKDYQKKWNFVYQMIIFYMNKYKKAFNNEINKKELGKQYDKKQQNRNSYNELMSTEKGQHFLVSNLSNLFFQWWDPELFKWTPELIFILLQELFGKTRDDALKELFTNNKFPWKNKYLLDYLTTRGLTDEDIRLLYSNDIWYNISKENRLLIKQSLINSPSYNNRNKKLQLQIYFSQ